MGHYIVKGTATASAPSLMAPPSLQLSQPASHFRPHLPCGMPSYKTKLYCKWAYTNHFLINCLSYYYCLIARQLLPFVQILRLFKSSYASCSFFNNFWQTQNFSSKIVQFKEKNLLIKFLHFVTSGQPRRSHWPWYWFFGASCQCCAYDSLTPAKRDPEPHPLFSLPHYTAEWMCFRNHLSFHLYHFMFYFTYCSFHLLIYYHLIVIFFSYLNIHLQCNTTYP